MDITAQMVKDLRQATNAGVLDCKKALADTNGDMEKATEMLKQKGLAIAAKKADRVALQGLVESYVHAGSRVAALIEVNCETDFVARTDQFKEMVHDLAMQVVASRPLYVRREEVPAKVIEEEKRKAQTENAGKPERIIEQITQGKLGKLYEENCLMEQVFIKNQEIKIKDLVTAKIAAFGENIIVRRFVRFELGE
jgi:elongation factor Ts